MSTVLDDLISALAVALNSVAKAMLANVHTTEWVAALVLAVALWLLAGRRGHPALALLLFVLAVGAGAWLSWRTGHTGVTVQQVALAVMIFHGIKGRGWIVKIGYKTNSGDK
jgi:hypothetical protein